MKRLLLLRIAQWLIGFFDLNHDGRLTVAAAGNVALVTLAGAFSGYTIIVAYTGT